MYMYMYYTFRTPRHLSSQYSNCCIATKVFIGKFVKKIFLSGSKFKYIVILRLDSRDQHSSS